MEEERKISNYLKAVTVNKKVHLVEIGKKLGLSKQGVSYVLNKKRDRDWSDWELEYWCKVCKADYRKAMEIKEGK